MQDIIRLSATKIARRLRRGDATPLEPIAAAAARIAAVELQVKALQSGRQALGRRAVRTPAASGVSSRSTDDMGAGR